MKSDIRVLHITESHSKLAGGVTSIVNELSQSIINFGGEASIFAVTNQIEFTPDDVHFIKIPTRGRIFDWLFSRQIGEMIAKAISDYDINIIHIHGAWLALQFFAAKYAYRNNIPFVCTFHGMFEPWVWATKKPISFFIKKIYFLFLSSRVFRQASAIHAITPFEHKNLQVLFSKNAIKSIPNAIDLEKYPSESNTDAYNKTVLFLGRIHPIKGVHILVDAFIQSKVLLDWKLIIAGPIEKKGYYQDLQAAIEKYKAADRIQFVGPIFGNEKHELMRCTGAVVVPSYSEVLGMVNLEAAANFTPTITTFETGLLDWEEGGGILIHPTVPELTKALETVTNWSASTRKERGIASRKLVEERYSFSVVDKEWKTLYSNLLVSHE